MNSLRRDIIESLSALILSKDEEKAMIKSRAKSLFKSDTIPTIDPEDIPRPKDAYTRAFTSFSGIDVSVYAGDKKLSTVQAISFCATPKDSSNGPTNPGQGTLIFAIFPDTMKEDYERLMNKYLGNLTIVYCNEFGDTVKQTLKKCEVESISYGISIDDLMSEINVTYSFGNLMVPEYTSGQEMGEETIDDQSE